MSWKRWLRAYPIAQLVLDYRQLVKLKGTYIDALPLLIRPATGRVHTTFNQTGAATGGFHPPIPTYRTFPFVPRKGARFERRFFPIRAGIWSLPTTRKLNCACWRTCRETPFWWTHSRAAKTSTHVRPPKYSKWTRLMITPDMRRAAKAVNFGIVYGQTPFGLAQSLGIDRKEADIYIKRYFERYAGVRVFIDRTIAEVRQSGVSLTLLGRRRPIPDMQSRNPAARSFAERTAVNTPLQGTAADLIKIAMIRIARVLKDEHMQSRMLLQVHDELVFEAPPEETESLRTLVKREMEGVHPVSVPLVVDVGVGKNWRDAK